jgi:hypothetical protein
LFALIAKSNLFSLFQSIRNILSDNKQYKQKRKSMGTAKVSTDFSSKSYTDTELGVTAISITDSMTGNRYFESPIPALEVIKATTTSYNAALAKAEKGSPDDRLVKNTLRTKLEGELKELGLYVQLTSKGDSLVISSSGFYVNKKPSVVGPLAKPENVMVKMGDNPGSVLVSCDSITSVVFYEFDYAEVTPDGVLNWIHKTSTKRKLLIEGLISGKQYVFRVAGAGSDPSRIWSDKITTFVV